MDFTYLGLDILVNSAGILISGILIQNSKVTGCLSIYVLVLYYVCSDLVNGVDGRSINFKEVSNLFREGLLLLWVEKIDVHSNYYKITPSVNSIKMWKSLFWSIMIYQKYPQFLRQRLIKLVIKTLPLLLWFWLSFKHTFLNWNIIGSVLTLSSEDYDKCMNINTK